MNETTKTAIIVGIGALLLAGGIYFLPSKADFTTESKVGEVLFPELKDGNVAQGMEIVSFDEKLSTRKDFAVKNLNGRWVLPSHNNYPADKKQQLVDAASSLVDLTALSEIKNVSPEQYELYGVLDPSEGELPFGATGVGKLVTFKDGGSKTLAKLIIGKQPREQGSLEDNKDNNLRYVRIAGQTPIYIVKLATDKFSPKFEDWIETNLLRPNEGDNRLNEFDIRKVLFQDYIFRPEKKTPPTLKSVALLDFNGQGQAGEWFLEKMVEFIDGTPKEITLTDQEELNTGKLDELKSALNDLKIVNVIRKPQGLIYALRGEGGGLDNEALESLYARGFYLPPVKSGGAELKSRDGEVSVSLRNGVVFKLYFGALVEELSELAETEQENNDSKNAPPKSATGTDRYLMVQAGFNPNLIPKPLLEEVPPEAPAPAVQKQEPKEDSKSPETKPANEVQPPPAKQPANAKEPSKGQAPSKDGKQSSQLESPFRTAAFQPPAKDAPQSDDSPAASQPQTTAPTSADPKAAEPKETLPEAPETKPENANDPADANFERNQIIRRNDAQQQAYNARIQAGILRAKSLNERFAEWYYVIPDEVYKKIHLGKNDIIMPRQPKTNQPE